MPKISGNFHFSPSKKKKICCFPFINDDLCFSLALSYSMTVEGINLAAAATNICERVFGFPELFLSAER
jgi:hypothetical protein